MGFNVTALAQKARTQTIIVDSDLDMGQYDVIATDVKGDTAEFSEFVGGVGNFESGLISGGLDVSGILHAEGNTQVDGNIILEGSINNVNITDDGEITTTKGVNGADFNGATISSNKFNGATITATKFNGATIDSTGNVTGAKGTFSGAVTGASFNGIVLKSSGTITVTPITGTFILPKAASDAFFTGMLTILPPVSNAVYSGSLTLTPSSSSASLMYFDGTSAERKTKSISNTSTFTFSNIPFLIAHSNPQISVSKFKLS